MKPQLWKPNRGLHHPKLIGFLVAQITRTHHNIHMISNNNQPSNYPSINLTKNLSRAQGLVRFVLDNQKEKLLQAGDVTALDAIRDTLRALDLAHNDLDDLLREQRDKRQSIMEQAFQLK